MLSVEPMMAHCMICNEEVEQDLVAHGPYVCMFNYSCGCTSTHRLNSYYSKEEVTWISKSGFTREEVNNLS